MEKICLSNENFEDSLVVNGVYNVSDVNSDSYEVEIIKDSMFITAPKTLFKEPSCIDSFDVDVTPSQLEELKVISEGRGISVEHLIIECLTKFLDSNKK